MRCWPLLGVRPTPPPADARFGAVRKHDIHSGVDLYAPEYSPVVAIEQGVVVSVLDFTGPDAGSDWWLPTKAVMVEGRSGVILYGEVHPLVQVGQSVDGGQPVGAVARVLRNDKGRPTSMLHLELYVRGTKSCCEQWKLGEEKPAGLLDPWSLVWAYFADTAPSIGGSGPRSKYLIRVQTYSCGEMDVEVSARTDREARELALSAPRDRMRGSITKNRTIILSKESP